MQEVAWLGNKLPVSPDRVEPGRLVLLRFRDPHDKTARVEVISQTRAGWVGKVLSVIDRGALVGHALVGQIVDFTEGQVFLG
jgi:hypothetical protein